MDDTQEIEVTFSTETLSGSLLLRCTFDTGGEIFKFTAREFPDSQ